jgi:hypothetical protein
VSLFPSFGFHPACNFLKKERLDSVHIDVYILTNDKSCIRRMVSVSTGIANNPDESRKLTYGAATRASHGMNLST